MTAQTWVARFVVDHGQVTEEGKILRTFHRRHVDEPDADLHLLAEPHGHNALDLASQALEAIGRAFARENLTLSGGLRRALAATNETLVDWNRRSLATQQASVGIAAVALRESVAYLVQAGPAVVLFHREGATRKLSEDEGVGGPLGEGELAVDVRRVDLRPGDILVAASPALTSVLDESTLAALLERGSDQALPELYLLTRDLPSFALFAVTCFETADEEPRAAHSLDETAEDPPAGRPEPTLTFETPAPAAPDPAPVLVSPPPLDISRPIVRLRSDQLSSRGDYARTTGPAGLRLNLPITRLLGLSLAVLFMVFVAAFAVPDLVKEGKQEKASTLLARAAEAIGQAEVDVDPSRKRKLLEEARRLTSEALRVEPGNVEASELRGRAVASLSAMDSILDLGPMTTVTTLGRQITGEVSVESLVVAGGTAYMLDAKGKRVIAIGVQGGGQPVAVYEEGEAYGDAVAKKPRAMAWDGSDTGGRLLVLDEERKLFEVRPGDAPRPLPLRRTNTWSSVQAIAAYDGNLYILDPEGNQIQRYLPSANGFDSEPGPALGSQSTVKGGIGIAVSGDIYVLREEDRGRKFSVHKFRAGVELDFPLAGIDRPLVSPTSLSLLANAGEILVADAGNKRIVVLSKDGAFLRQFVSNAFTDLRSMAVDASGAQVYVVVGDALLTAPLRR